MPFTNNPWNGPAIEAALDAADFCKVALIDTNETGEDKVKAKCKLPVRATPGGPFNRQAIRNAMGRIFQLTGVSSEDRSAAAKRLARLASEGGIQITSPAFRRLAGLPRK